MSPLSETDYKIHRMEDTDWVMVSKNDKVEALVIDWNEGLRAVHTFENKPTDHFFAADSNGIVTRVDRGML